MHTAKGAAKRLPRSDPFGRHLRPRHPTPGSVLRANWKTTGGNEAIEPAGTQMGFCMLCLNNLLHGLTFIDLERVARSSCRLAPAYLTSVGSRNRNLSRSRKTDRVFLSNGDTLDTEPVPARCDSCNR